MKACAQFEEQLIDAAAGSAAVDLLHVVEAHAAACAACRARLEGELRLFASLDSGLAAMVAGEPSPEFAARVSAEVTGDAEHKLLAKIDTGIAQTVAAEPSPRFAAAVRARIDAEPPRPAAWFNFAWWMPVTGALAAMLLLAVMWRARTDPEKRSPPAIVRNEIPATSANRTSPGQSSAGIPAAAATTNAAGASRLKPNSTARASTTASIGARGTVLPEVLIPEDEVRAVGRFYRFVQEGRINTAQVMEANRLELAVVLKQLETPALFAADIGLALPLRTLDLVDSPRSTSDNQ